MAEHGTKFAFKGKREHMAKVNMPTMAYPNQHTDIETPHGWRDHVIVSGTVKITFNLEVESTGIIIINLFIVDNKNTIKNIFLSTNVALKTWLI